MARDHALEWVLEFNLWCLPRLTRSYRTIPEDGEFGVAAYSAALEILRKENRNTWFTAPWLYAECVFFSRVRFLSNVSLSRCYM